MVVVIATRNTSGKNGTFYFVVKSRTSPFYSPALFNPQRHFQSLASQHGRESFGEPDSLIDSACRVSTRDHCPKEKRHLEQGSLIRRRTGRLVEWHTKISESASEVFDQSCDIRGTARSQR